VHVPSLDMAKLSQYFRATVIGFFLERRLIDQRLAKNLLDWTHSGFSVDLTVKIPATSPKTRVSLAEYIPWHRGRSGALDCAAPPSEPDKRICRIRLSSQRFTVERTDRAPHGLRSWREAHGR
jgi:hypothetical protein